MFDRLFGNWAKRLIEKRRGVVLPPAIILVCIVIVKFVVDPTSRAVAANVDFAVTSEGTPVTINVLANDKERDGAKLKLVGVVQGTKGSVKINDDNTVTYTPRADYNGLDVFSYTVTNGKGGRDSTGVQVSVTPVNDPPVIVSKPVTVATAASRYVYDVNAADPDAGDKLTYSLVTAPKGMVINPATGLIVWMPSDVRPGNYDVVVKVVDSSPVPGSDTQSFSISVGKPGMPHKVVLAVVDVYDQGDVTKLLEADRARLVRASDDRRWQTDANSYACYDFADADLPADAVITSAVLHVEHFEQGTFAEGDLQWSIGAGWPNAGQAWASTNMPVHAGSTGEATDVWDVTSLANTVQKVNALQLLVKNNSRGQASTFVDYVYVVLEWEQGEALLKKP
jgi:hypothetical protein